MVATVAARVTGDPDAAAAFLRRQIALVDRDLPVVTISTMEHQIAAALMTQRLGSSLTRWFSLLAIVLAVTGTYGLVAYSVARRTSEIGVRIALGASPAKIPFLVLRSGLVPVLIGIVVGIVVAWPTTRLIRGFLFGVPAGDPVSFVGAPLVLLSAAGVAGYLAARRAARIDPIRALRAE
jgi:ABC-type antimicrobial peptide transport system permease subunit